jgi:hypothetical protein
MIGKVLSGFVEASETACKLEQREVCRGGAASYMRTRRRYKGLAALKRERYLDAEGERYWKAHRANDKVVVDHSALRANLRFCRAESGELVLIETSGVEE